MRSAPAGVVLVLTSCTLVVPIDDGVSAGRPDAATPGVVPDAGPSIIPSEAGPSPEGGTTPPVVAREGCPGPADDPDLIGWYPLDETSGDVAHDCSPSKIDLSPLGGVAPAWTAGKLGGGAEFDGLNTCFTADGGAAFRFDSGEPFTIAAWAFVREFFEADKTGRWIASHKVSPYGWHFGADDPDRMEIDFEWVEGATNKKTQVAGRTTASTWIHVLATYSPGDASLYINGKREQRTLGPTVPSQFKELEGRFHIGCRNLKVNTFKGTIDDVRIYRRVFTEAEAATLAARL